MSSATILPEFIAHSARKSFARVPEVVGVPDLIQIQHKSYQWFMDEGLRELLEEISPLNDYTGNRLEIHFLEHEIGAAKHSEQECQERDMTYAAPIKVKTRLIVKETGEIKEQDLFMGDFPIMTSRGTFIINGAERVVVNQLIRSPGVYFTIEKDVSTARRLCFAKLIPDRGIWVEFETSNKGVISTKLNRKRKIPVTTLLRALGYGSNEQLLDLFSDIDTGDISYIQATMERDPRITSVEEALPEFFKKIRPGEPPTVENGKALIDTLFFDPRRYRLGKGGCYKLNKRLGLNRPLKQQTLVPSDFVAIVRKIIAINNGSDSGDDIDHLGNRRVRAVGELLQSHLKMGLLRMERTIKERMSLLDPASATPSTLVNNRAVTAAIREFFGSSRLSQFMDQTNPLSELTHKRRLSALGPGGFSRDRAGFEVRDVHHSHYGRICPIETPEGRNIGLITSLATYARVNEYGFIETPYRKVIKELPNDAPELLNRTTREPVLDKKGKVIIDKDTVIDEKVAHKLANLSACNIQIIPYVSKEIEFLPADEEDKHVIAQANARLDENDQFIESKIEVRRAEKVAMEIPEVIDYKDISTTQIASVSTALIPFLEHDDANRALMGSNMQRQAVPIIGAESPIVGTGMEREVARDSGQVILAPDDGTVTSSTGTHVEFKGKDGNIYSYNLKKFVRSNQGTCTTQHPVVNKGDRIKKGEVLVDGSATDKGELALGQNVLCAFMAWEGYNYEDAIVVSERLVQDGKYTSIHIEKHEVEARDTKLGPEEITRDIPNVGEASLRNLDQDGIIRVGAEVASGDILVGKVTPKGERVLTAEEKLLRAIFGEKARDVKDTALRMPHGETGKVISVDIFSRENGDHLDAGVNKMVRIFVAQKRELSEGDKLAGRHGNKGVISKILPVEDMPYLDDGRPVDVVLSPLGVPSRMNIGQLLETHLGLAAHDLGFKAVTPVFNGADEDTIEEVLAQAWFIRRVVKENQGEFGSKSERIEKTKQWLSERGFDGDKLLGDNSNGEARRTCLRFWLEEQNISGVSEMSDEELKQTVKRLERDKKIPSPISGKLKLRDGRSGEAFHEPTTVGHMYIMKLIHLVEDKIHARSTGPYSLVTQQPLGGKAQFGGQRFGEMEVWALEAYGAAYNLQEMLTIKSDDVVGRVKTYGAIVKGEDILSLGVPESFKVLVKELQSLGLAIEVFSQDEQEVLRLKGASEEVPRLGINLSGIEIEENE